MLIQIGGPQPKVTEDTLKLVIENQRFTRDLIALDHQRARSARAGVDALVPVGMHALPRPERQAELHRGRSRWRAPCCRQSAWSRSSIAYGIQAHDFVSHGIQTYPEANALLTKTSVVIPQILNDLGALLIAVGLVMVSLNAMRVGLLTRFLGYVGIIAGVFTIIPLVPIPIVEAYWLLALAYLFSGRWPSGVPPAWTTRPRRALADARQRQRPAREPLLGRGRGKPAPEPAPEPVGAPAPGEHALEHPQAQAQAP